MVKDIKPRYSDIPQLTHIPSHDARLYIRDMMEELWELADTAKLNDIANLLKVTLTAIETESCRK